MPTDAADLVRLVGLFGALTPWVHLDVADGIFAPNPQWPMNSDAHRAELEEYAAGTKALPSASYEVHLMAQDPLTLGEAFARAGAQRVIGHVETFSDTKTVREAFATWKRAGATEVGIALSLDTPLSSIEEIARECDVVQLMSIRAIGFQGQVFEEGILSRLEEFHAEYPETMLSVDGGVSEATVESLVRAGANRLVVGSALVQSDAPTAVYGAILERAILGCAPREGEKSSVAA